MGHTRNRTLDVMKIFATFFILFHHYQQVYEIVSGSSYEWGGIKFYGGIFYWGAMVELFFLISGFCMFPYIEKISKGKTFYQFYARRVARLLPLMALSGLFCAIAKLFYQNVYGTDFLGEPSLFGVALQALGIQEGWGFKNPSLNNPTWYCSVLLLCYVVFYCVIFWANRLRVSPVYGFVFFLLLGCSQSNYDISGPFLNGPTARGFYSFFAGVLLAGLMPKIKKWRWSTLVSAILIVTYAIVYSVQNGEIEYGTFTLTFLLYPAIIILLNGFPCDKLCGFSVWEKWAKITYSVFIWHLPFYMVLYIVLPILKIDLSVMGHTRTMIICAIVLQLLGWISYHFLEQPFNNKMLSWLMSMDPAQLKKYN